MKKVFIAIVPLAIIIFFYLYNPPPTETEQPVVENTQNEPVQLNVKQPETALNNPSENGTPSTVVEKPTFINLDVKQDKRTSFFSEISPQTDLYDYDLGRLKTVDVENDRGIKLILSFFENITDLKSLSVYFHQANVFYLTQRLGTELKHGVIPQAIRVGIPVPINEYQINYPVKFFSGNNFTLGEIIIDRTYPEWVIIDFAVDFKNLEYSQVISSYEDIEVYQE